MIFVTIGTQEPFDRLIKAVDEIAATIQEEEVIAQTSESAYVVQHMKTVAFLSPVEFNKLFDEARLIVSHAGMGTVISALTKQKPILVMPRRASLGEHRNDHQMASAKKLHELNFIHVAYDEEELKEKILALIKAGDPQPLHHLGEWASDELIQSLQKFVHP